MGDKEDIMRLIETIHNQNKSLSLLDVATDDINRLRNDWIGVLFATQLNDAMKSLDEIRMNVIQIRYGMEETIMQRLDKK